MSDGDASNSSNQTQAEARKTANVESVLAQQPAASTEKTTIANPGNTSSSPSSQNATTTTSPATPTTTLREDLIKSAVSFLSSPNVRSAETAKKVAFLRQKGLSQEEIEEAFKRVGDSTSMTATVQQSQPSSAVVAGPPRPAVPPRPAAMYQAPPPPPQVVYYNPPPPPAMPLQRIIAMAFILGFGAVGITAAILKVIKRFIGPIFETIANYQRGRYNERKSLWEKLQDKLKEDDSNSSESSTALLQKSESLAKSLERIVDLARDRAEDVRDEPYSEFRDKLNDFKSTLSDPDHIFSSFSSYTLYAPMGMNSREPKAVQDFKSEIRSFKGMLLNRRNFPMVNTPKSPLSPSATTSSPSPTTTVRDVPIYHPRRRQSYRSELAQETDSSQISSSSTPALEKNPV